MTAEPLDLEAARADIATVAATDGRVYGIDGLDEVRAAQAAQGRIVDRHAPALLAAVDEQAAVISGLRAAANKRCDENLATFNRQRALIERLGAEVKHVCATREDVSGRLIAALAENERLHAALDAANARTAERCRQLMAAQRTVEQANAERDHWQRVAAGGGDCPVVGCNGEVLRLETWGGEEFARLDCGHDPAATVGTEAPPAVDEYRVQVHDAVDSDLPSGGWTAISSAQDTVDEAVAAMRRRRAHQPRWGPLRVIQVRRSYTVVAVEESAGDVKPPESPAGPSAHLGSNPGR